MTTDTPRSDNKPFDCETFETELAELVAHARKSGVDLDGAYDVRTPHPDQSDYTVEISRMAPRTNPHRS